MPTPPASPHDPADGLAHLDAPPRDGALDIAFLTPGAQTVGDVARRLAAVIASAEREVVVAIYDFDLERGGAGDAVAEALQAAQARGVSVRVCDHDERTVERRKLYPPPASPPEYVDSLGLDVHPVTDFLGLMHHKYVVVDRRIVWTGSLNWTDDAFTLQENCVVRVASAELAAAYMTNFEELWARRKVEGSGKRKEGWSGITLDGAGLRVRPYFCPGRGPELASAIATAVRAARHRIGICSPVLTSGPILGALGDVLTDGRVPITGVVDRTQMDNALHQWTNRSHPSWKAEAYRHIARSVPFAGKRSTPWAPGRTHDYMHAKIVVADDVAFVGSYNHSRSGEQNAENVLAIEGAAAADLLMAFVAATAARYADPAAGRRGA